MIGWKRIVVTVGERIGKTHLTYAQGASAEIVAMATIGAADMYGLPVSTTHVLSSGVAGHDGGQPLRTAMGHGAQSADGLGAHAARCRSRSPAVCTGCYAPSCKAASRPREAARGQIEHFLEGAGVAIVRVGHVAQPQFRRVLQKELYRGARLARLHGLQLAQVVPIHRQDEVEAREIICGHPRAPAGR